MLCLWGEAIKLVPDMLAGVGFDYIPSETSNVVRLTQKREKVHHTRLENKHLHVHVPKEVGGGGGVLPNKTGELVEDNVHWSVQKRTRLFFFLGGGGAQGWKWSG